MGTRTERSEEHFLKYIFHQTKKNGIFKTDKKLFNIIVEEGLPLWSETKYVMKKYKEE